MTTVGDTVNLRQFRKRRKREADDAAAQANRKKFGIPGKLRKSAAQENALAAAKLDGHKRSSEDKD